MIEYYLINDEGYFICQVLMFEQNSADFPNYIGVEPNWNLNKPKWDGMQWIEGFSN